MAAQPCLIGQARGRGGHHQIGGFAYACDGYISFNPAMLVEELGIDDFADRNRHISAADTVEETLCIAPFHPQFSEGRHVVHPDTCPDGTVFLGGVVEPVLAFPAVRILFALPICRVPIGAFPSRDFAKNGSLCFKLLVKRGTAHTARGGLLAVREMVSIKQPKCFFGAFKEVMFVALKGLHSGNIDIPKIKWFFACVHPLAESHSSPSCRLDANRIESCSDPDIVHFRGKAKMIGIIRRKAFWPVEKGVNSRFAKHRHAVDSHFQNGFEMIEIFGKLVEFKIFWNACHCPRLGIGFKCPQHHFACILFVIGTFIGYP